MIGLIKNKKGAAMVYVVIAVAVMLILTVTVTIVAYNNMSEQANRSASDRNEYTAGGVMEAVVSGLQREYASSYDYAYRYVMTQYDNYDSEESAFGAFVSLFREKFDNDLGGDAEKYDPSVLFGYVTNAYKANNFTVSADNGRNDIEYITNGFIMKNVHITYEDRKDSSSTGRIDEVLTDITITVPDSPFRKTGTLELPDYTVIAGNWCECIAAPSVYINGDVTALLLTENKESFVNGGVNSFTALYDKKSAQIYAQYFDWWCDDWSEGDFRNDFLECFGKDRDVYGWYEDGERSTFGVICASDNSYPLETDGLMNDHYGDIFLMSPLCMQNPSTVINQCEGEAYCEYYTNDDNRESLERVLNAKMNRFIELSSKMPLTINEQNLNDICYSLEGICQGDYNLPDGWHVTYSNAAYRITCDDLPGKSICIVQSLASGYTFYDEVGTVTIVNGNIKQCYSNDCMLLVCTGYIDSDNEYVTFVENDGSVEKLLSLTFYSEDAEKTFCLANIFNEFEDYIPSEYEGNFEENSLTIRKNITFSNWSAE